MSMSRFVKKLARFSVGVAFRNLRFAERIAFHAMSSKFAVQRVISRGIDISTVLDVGASDGRWSLSILKLFPGARYHLVEANAYHKPSLDRLIKKHDNFSYTLAVGSDQDGTVYFDPSNPFGGSAAKEKRANMMEFPATTLDTEIEKFGLLPPYLIKLDTHGFELPILNGARNALNNTSLAVMETYNFQLQPNALKFYEMCEFMERRGFSVIDLSQPAWRPRDYAFWQMDIFFVPSQRHEFDYTRYR
jgi:FkbM family methyltransferase